MPLLLLPLLLLLLCNGWNWCCSCCDRCCGCCCVYGCGGGLRCYCTRGVAVCCSCNCCCCRLFGGWSSSSSYGLLSFVVVVAAPVSSAVVAAFFLLLTCLYCYASRRFACLFTYLLMHARTDVLTYLRTYLLTDLLTDLILRTYLPTYLLYFAPLTPTLTCSLTPRFSNSSTSRLTSFPAAHCMGQEMLKARRVFLTGEVNDESAKVLCCYALHVSALELQGFRALGFRVFSYLGLRATGPGDEDLP